MSEKEKSPDVEIEALRKLRELKQKLFMKLFLSLDDISRRPIVEFLLVFLSNAGLFDEFMRFEEAAEKEYARMNESHDAEAFDRFFDEFGLDFI